MLPVRTILCPTDFSPPASNAFQVACALARDYGARLVVAHILAPQPIGGTDMVPVFPPDPVELKEELRKQLSALRSAEPTIPVEHRLCDGDPATGILQLAAERKADLIVMGTHGRTGLGRLLIGSVAEAVLRRAPCPVLTVKSPIAEAMSDPSPRAPATAGV